MLKCIRCATPMEDGASGVDRWSGFDEFLGGSMLFDWCESCCSVLMTSVRYLGVLNILEFFV